VDRKFARTQGVHPCPKGDGDRKQEQPGTDHPHSVGTRTGSGNPPSARPCSVGGRPHRHARGYNPAGSAYVGGKR
jgi:hypothetical protein